MNVRRDTFVDARCDDVMSIKSDTVMKIAVLVSGEGSNLQALIDAGLTPYIKIVIAPKQCNALKRAENASIPTAIIPDCDDSLLDALEDIDLIVLAGYLKILTGEILKHFKNRIINVHPSLIPQFCGEGMYGLNVHKAVLEAGVKTTGATVHYVNEVVDGGEIIAQKTVEVKEDDTPEILQQRVMREAEWKILPAVIKQIMEKD